LHKLWNKIKGTTFFIKQNLEEEKKETYHIE